MKSFGGLKILLISPETPDTFWSFKHVLRFVAKKSTFPPLGLLTVAAMLPKEWQLRLIDLDVGPLSDLDIVEADLVMISAMLVHETSVRQVVARCAALHKRVVAGGPLFTTGYESFPEIPHFVLGEAEDIMPRLVADIRDGHLQHVYRSDARPSMAASPVPRWELIDMRNYVTMAVQFSRGCPFDCEFCDIVVMNGRTPRTKAPAQVLAELEVLRRRGWKDMVFIVDDNFIGNKARTRELLRELIAWRHRTGAELGFLTEASVNLADDFELRSLMVEAGFRKVFVGIETPQPESLQECRKVQNQGRDLLEAVETLQGDGLQVMGGFIIGFDNDKPDIFKRQFDFIQRSGIVTAMVGLLTALPRTRLYQRLLNEGRLECKSSGNNTDATLNFRPMLNREYLQSGYRDLMKRLYEPSTYYERVRTFLKHHRVRGPRLRLSPADFQAFLKAFWWLGVWHRGRLAYWKLLLGTVVRRPGHLREAIEFAVIGYHFRRVAHRL